MVDRHIRNDPWLCAIPLRIRYPKLFQISIQKETKVFDMIVIEGAGLEILSGVFTI